MEKETILIITFDKGLIDYDDETPLSNIAVMRNTINEHIFGDIHRANYSDFYIAVLKGTLNDKYNIVTFNVSDFSADTILDFNILFNKSAYAFYYVDLLEIQLFAELLNTIQAVQLKHTTFSLVTNKIIDIRSSKIKDTFLAFFEDILEESNITYDYIKLDINIPGLYFDMDLQKQIDIIIKADLNYDYIEVLDKTYDKVAYRDVYTQFKKHNPSFKGFIVYPESKSIGKFMDSPYVAIVSTVFTQHLANFKFTLKHYNKLAILINVNDEFTIDNILDWLEFNYESIKYATRNLPTTADSYSIEIFNMLTQPLIDIVFNLKPFTDEEQI